MSTDPSVLATTTSLCPTCLDPVPGRYQRRDDAVYLTRECPDHGTASRQVWADADHWAELRQTNANIDGAPCGDSSECACGTDADLTVDHDHSCVAIIEVTQNCNLECSYCFAGSGPGGKDRPAQGVRAQLDAVVDAGGPRPVQFSGGEPTVRDDLPALVTAARTRGIEHVQVNTNGIRVAREPGYATELADAGVTALYLQFDGVSGETYEALRDVDLWDTKQAAIEAARQAGLSVVLVPTVVPGVNDDELGAIVRFGLDNLDVVRSINVQPVAHFGRVADDGDRFSLDRVADTLAGQFEGLERSDFVPVPCCSGTCQLTTAIVSGPGGEAPITRFVDTDLFSEMTGQIDEADWMELLAGTESGAAIACESASCCGVSVPDGLEAIADLVLPITLTGFMDADAADVEKLENCCLSIVTDDGELVPFCGYTMTTDDGRYALRNRYGWGGRPAVDEPVPDTDAWVSADDD